MSGGEPAAVGGVRLGEGLRDEALRIVDPGLDRHLHIGFAGEPCLVADVDVDGEDDGIGGIDDGLVDRGRAARSLGLGDDVDAHLGAGLGERVGGHIGVSNSRRAGRDGDDAAGIVGRGCGGFGGGC